VSLLLEELHRPRSAHAEQAPGVRQMTTDNAELLRDLKRGIAKCLELGWSPAAELLLRCHNAMLAPSENLTRYSFNGWRGCAQETPDGEYVLLDDVRRAALSAQSEPVAWLYRWNGAKENTYPADHALLERDNEHGEGWTVTPLIYAHSVASAQVPGGAWLVELQCNQKMLGWLSGDEESGMGWTTDPNEAIRFSRKIDADRFRKRFGFTCDAESSRHLSTEHLWL
jgi:hypothetical protein